MPSLFTPEEQQARDLYTQTLGTEPSNTELEELTTLIHQGKPQGALMTRLMLRKKDQVEAKIAAFKKTHPEAFNQAKHLYRTLLAREPSPLELADLEPQFTAGLTVQALEARIRQLPEYTNRAREEANRVMITRQYERLLGRGPSPDEMNRWLGELSNGRTGEQELVRQLELSASAGKQAEVITQTYRSVLKRTPRPEEISAWQTWAGQGHSLDKLAEELKKTPEFQHLPTF